MAKGRRTMGEGMSNTDNMRLVGVVSTQLSFQQFVKGDGSHLDAATTVPLGAITSIDRLGSEGE